MIKKLSCVSCGSLKRFPHTFTTMRHMLGESMYSPVFRWINCPVKFSLIVWPTKNYPVAETEHYFCSVSNIIFVQSQTSKGDQKWRLTGQKKSESGQKNHSVSETGQFSFGPARKMKINLTIGWSKRLSKSTWTPL